MMYLLTAEEYSTLLERKAAHEGLERTKLQAVCTRIANELPVVRERYSGFASDTPDDRPWGCILDPATQPGYCDQCPVSEICPHPHKEWSK